MLGVCLNASGGEEFHHQWDYVLLNWQPDRVWVVGELWKSRALKNAGSIEVIDELPDHYDKVIAAHSDGRYLQGNTPLVEFEHPADCIYIFGPDDGYLRPDEIDLSRILDTVYIPTPNNPEMFSFVAAAIMLNDRVNGSG